MSPLRVLTGAGGFSGGGRVHSDALVSRLSRLLLTFAFLLVPVLLAHAQTDTSAVAPTRGIWDRIAHFIVQPWATFALLAVGCLFLFHEMLTPHTWGFSGNTGALCIGLVIASEVTVGNNGWVGVLLLLVGLTLVLLEVHLYPGYGVAIGGFILMFAGMFLSLGGTQNTVFALAVTSVLMVVSGLAFLAYLPKSPAWQRRFQENAAASAEPMLTVGQRGTVTTALHPWGVAEFNGVAVNVITEGDFLDPGAPVQVERIEDDRIVVEPADTPEANAAGRASAG
jgi:membrane-bound serine protease (ClpP class)